jgi:hypothetical protein
VPSGTLVLHVACHGPTPLSAPLDVRLLADLRPRLFDLDAMLSEPRRPLPNTMFSPHTFPNLTVQCTGRPHPGQAPAPER